MIKIYDSTNFAVGLKAGVYQIYKRQVDSFGNEHYAYIRDAKDDFEREFCAAFENKTRTIANMESQLRELETKAGRLAGEKK